MKTVQLGIVGCGVIGSVHVRSAKANPQVNLVAVADIKEEARQAARNFGVPTVYPTAGKLFADQRIEAVVLALPTGVRTKLALRALKAGKHVLVEKPVAMNFGEVNRMIKARGNLIAGCCSSRFRTMKSAQALTDFIATGALGDLRVIHCRCLGPAHEPPKKTPPTWRLRRAENGGGYLVNWGCYDLDYLLGITGWTLKPKWVLAQTWTVPELFVSHVAPASDAESHILALIRCENGTTISFERAEYSTAPVENAWQIVGSKGSLRLDMLPGPGKKILFSEGSTEQGITTRTLWEGDEEWNGLHAGVLADFAQAVAEGRQPLTTLEKALVLQKITDAIYTSAARRRPVQIK
jgi:predicted dehydrogenase